MVQLYALSQVSTMPDDNTATAESATSQADAVPPRELPPAAQRALAEAAERRRMRAEEDAKRPKEIGGRDGPDPVRFGDWEKGGIAWDF
jgi:hypothetical protein